MVTSMCHLVIPFPLASPAREVQPPPEHRCKALSLPDMTLRPCWLHPTAPQASPTLTSPQGELGLPSDIHCLLLPRCSCSSSFIARPHHLVPQESLPQLSLLWLGHQISYPEVQELDASSQFQAVSWHGNGARPVEQIPEILPICLPTNSRSQPLTWCL